MVAKRFKGKKASPAKSAAQKKKELPPKKEITRKQKDEEEDSDSLVVSSDDEVEVEQNNQKKDKQKQKNKGKKEEKSNVDDDDDDNVKKGSKKHQKQKQKEQNKGKNKNSKKKESSDEDSSGDADDDKEDDSSESGDDGKQNKVKKSKTKESDDDDDGSDSSSEDDDDKNAKGSGFTDENAAWLKPKNKAKPKSQLLSSDDEDSDKDDDDEIKPKKSRDKSSDSESDSDDDDESVDDEDEMLDIEKEAQMLDEEEEAERQEAEEEMQRQVREHTSIYHLPTVEELEIDVDRVVPPSELRSHIESILEVLAAFKDRREPGRSRREYIDRLGSFIAELFGYVPELVEYFLTMFGPAETLEFVEISDKSRPLVIRANTLKTRRKDLAAALMKRGVSLDPLANWSKVGLKIIESPVPIGATPEYLSGHYMLQSAASMLPVLALSPEPKETVLDMAAAPGGKTSYIAQLMRNTGVIFANDLKIERQKSTVANMHRLGVKNVIAFQHDGRKLGKLFKERFDRILLDAPCSGLGVISRDPSVKVQRTMADINNCARLQKELLLSAIDSLRCKGTGGVMVYSTCSVSVAENEEVINYALSKRDIRIIETGLDFGKPGFVRYQQKRFHPSVALTRRFYPHVHNMDGFFVCKIKKLSNKILTENQLPEEAGAEQEAEVENEDEGKEKIVDSKKKKNGKSGKKTDKKRKLDSKSDKDNKEENQKEEPPKKLAKVSIPPKKPAEKKKRQNAKVTKPRRTRAAQDA